MRPRRRGWRIGSLVVVAAFYSGNVRIPLVGAAAAAFVSDWWLQRTGMTWPLLVGAGSAGWFLTRTRRLWRSGEADNAEGRAVVATSNEWMFTSVNPAAENASRTGVTKSSAP